ncbi:MAG: signal peptidase II [Bacillota bacterium]
MLFFIITIIIVIIDQTSKFLAVKYLFNQPSIDVIPKILNLTYAQNTGAAFSILRGKQFFLQSITGIVILFLIYMLFKEVQTNGKFFYKLSLSFILGGAIGNLIDRVRLNYVIDYFDVQFMDFAIFNIADSFIVVGTIFLGYLIIFDKI